MRSPAAAGAIVAVLIAGVAALGDRQRMRRTEPDRVGWVDWRTLQLIAIAAALILVGLTADG